MVRAWLGLTAGVAALAFGVPAVAEPAPAADAVPAVTPILAPPRAAIDPAIDLFYGARQGAPIWLKDDAGRAAAQAMAGILRNAAIDGLSDGPQRAPGVEPAIAANDDKALSAEWVAYVHALKGPVQGISYGDP